MKAGELRHRGILQEPVAGTNAIREVVPVWTDVATIWMAIEPYTGSWGFAAKQANSTAKGRIRIRYRSDIQPTWRVKFGDRYLYFVTFLNPEERNRELIIEYSEALD